MNILDFTDVNDYFGENKNVIQAIEEKEIKWTEEKEIERSEVFEEKEFSPYCFKNLLGRIICFEDLAQCQEYTMNEYANCADNPSYRKKVKYYLHPPGLKTYVLSINGYIIVDNKDLDRIITSNEILNKLVENGKLLKCSEEECKGLKLFTNSEEIKKKFHENTIVSNQNIADPLANEKIQILRNEIYQDGNSHQSNNFGFSLIENMTDISKKREVILSHWEDIEKRDINYYKLKCNEMTEREIAIHYHDLNISKMYSEKGKSHTNIFKTQIERVPQ